jgi:DNA-binding response OmpR family regulator
MICERCQTPIPREFKRKGLRVEATAGRAYYRGERLPIKPVACLALLELLRFGWATFDRLLYACSTMSTRETMRNAIISKIRTAFRVANVPARIELIRDVGYRLEWSNQ